MPDIGDPRLDLWGDVGNASLNLGGGAPAPEVLAQLALRTGGARLSLLSNRELQGAVALRTGGALFHLTLGHQVNAVLALRTAPARLGLEQRAPPPKTRGAYLALTATMDPNLPSAVHGIAGTSWRQQQQTQTITASASGTFCAARTQTVSRAVLWIDAPVLDGTAAPTWRTAARVSQSGISEWTAAPPQRASQSPNWAEAPQVRQGARGHWQDAHSVNRGTSNLSHVWLPLVVESHVERWREGPGLTHSRRYAWRDGPLLFAWEIETWRDAILVPYIRRRHPAIVIPPPKYIHDWTARLCMGVPLHPTILDLGFWGCRPGPPRIPRLRSYIVLHAISVVRLPDRLPIDTESFGINLDADAWAWTWSGTLVGREALTAVLPSVLGEPVTLEVTINGHRWHLLVEDWTENREFGKRSIAVSGRGLSAWLSSPYELPRSGVTTEDLSLQQALADRLPFGSDWALVWAANTPDWLVPAGAWGWTNAAPIQIIQAAARDVGLIVVPGMADHTLTVMPRYPILPWQFAGADPDLTIPDNAILTLSRRQVATTQANAVYVHGESVAGILARLWRTGTAGDREAATTTSSLITHVDGARLLGTRLLAAEAQQPAVRNVTLPLGGDFPLGRVGQLLAIEHADETETRGIINAVSINVTGGPNVTVRQTWTIGEETPNTWARFRRLLPEPPLLAGKIAQDHQDGTVTVALIGGAAQRVRGTGTVGAMVWMRDGVVEGEAPALGSAVEIEV